MARRAWSIAVVAGLLGAAAPAHAADDAARLGRAATSEVVHVEPGAADRLPADAAARLRIQIAQEATGRVKVLVVPADLARRNRGAAAFADEILERGGIRGALILVAGADAEIAASYDAPQLARAERGIRGRELASPLGRAVERIARVDPGPSGDAGAATPPAGAPGSAIEDSADDFLDSIVDILKTAVFAVLGVILLVVLIPFLVWAYVARGRRKEGAEELRTDCSLARDELIAIGETLRELDIDSEMPGSDPEGKEALGRALELYKQADRELAKAKTRRKLERAQSTIGRARSDANIAKRRLGGVPAQPSLDA